MTIRSIRNQQWMHSKANRKGHKLTGLALVAVGFFWFAKKIGWIPVAAGSAGILWPAVTIAAGVALVFSANRHIAKRNGNDLPMNAE